MVKLKLMVLNDGGVLMNQEQLWVVEKIANGLVYFINGSNKTIVPLGLLPGKVAPGDIVRIDYDHKGNILSLKVVLKNVTER